MALQTPAACMEGCLLPETLDMNTTGGLGDVNNITSPDLSESALEPIPEGHWPLRIFGAVVGGAMILLTLLGNVMVIVVVSKFRRLRSVTNLLLASLATADITVALLVMPLLVMFDLERTWRLGPVACHLWISCDVMCCTASILHLCIIALDRFWAITRPLRYRSFVSKRKIAMFIVGIWICSAAISFIPIFMGWYSDGTVSLADPTPDCSLKVNRVYAVVSSMTSFYLPLPVMFYVYFRILLIAERQSRDIKQLERSLHTVDQHTRRSLRRRSRQLLTDTKAIRTLGIVMGVFCVCWLPFFLMYLIMAYCTECPLAYEVQSAITWLGYCNSAFNPCIYVFLNRDFKEAFRKVLLCRSEDREHHTMIIDDGVSSCGRNAQRMDRLYIEAMTPELGSPVGALDGDSAWPKGMLYSPSPSKPTACSFEDIRENR